MPTLGKNKDRPKEEDARAARMSRRNNNKDEDDGEPTTPKNQARRGKKERKGDTPTKIKNLKPAEMEDDTPNNNNNNNNDDDDASMNSLEREINNAEKDLNAAMFGNESEENKEGEINNEGDVNEGGADAGTTTTSGGMGNANTPTWTPRVPTNNNNNSTTSSNTSTGGSTTSSARFSTDTSYKAAVGGKVGGNVRRQNKRASGGAKKIVHEHSWYAAVTFKIDSCKDVQKGVVDKFGDILTTIRKKDEEAAIINASDEITKAFTKAQLPQELDDLVNEWLHVEGNQKSIFANNIPTGKNRSYEAVLFLGTQWEPSKLIEKTALQLMKINVDMSYKRIQELHTVKYMLLMGAPNNLHPDGVEQTMNLILREVADMMKEEDETRYSQLMWGPEAPFPFFKITRSYVKHAPYVTRGKNEKTPSWQRMVLHLEHKPEDAYDISFRCQFANKRKLFKKYFGKFCFFLVGPQKALGEGERAKLGTMIARHGSVNLCMGCVPIRGVINPDEKVCIERADDYEGNKRAPLVVSLRDILMSVKLNGERLFMCLNMTDNGDYEVWYPNGKGCVDHKARAKAWGELPGGNLKFYLLKRGLNEFGVNMLIDRAFTTEEVLSAEGCKLLEDGTVINKSSAMLQDNIDEIEACYWVDETAGLLESELKEMQRGGARTRNAVIDPSSMAAFNFTKDDNTVVIIRKGGSHLVPLLQRRIKEVFPWLKTPSLTCQMGIT